MALRSFTERRRHPRVGAIRQVVLRFDGAHKAVRAQLVDVSESGLRGVAPLPDVAVGTRVSLEMSLPGWLGARKHTLPASVVRLGMPISGSPHREFALEFGAQPEAVARSLARFVREALRAHEKVGSVQGQDSPLADALRMVRVSLGPAKPDRARVVVIASAAPGEGKSFTAGHLAALLASEGQRVLLVDADLRSPSLAANFGAAQSPGFADWLADGAEQPIAAFSQPTRSGVALVAAGRNIPLAEGWSREDALAVVERIRVGDWDYVVIDSPPLLIAALSSLLAASADDVLLVARAGLTREADLLDARRLLERHGANLRGVVLNDHVDSPQTDYESYYRTPRRSLRQLVRRSPAEVEEDAVYELPDGR